MNSFVAVYENGTFTVSFKDKSANPKSVLGSKVLSSKTKTSYKPKTKLNVSDSVLRMGFMHKATKKLDCLGLPKLHRGVSMHPEEWRRNLLGKIFKELKNENPNLSCADIAKHMGYHENTLYGWSLR